MSTQKTPEAVNKNQNWSILDKSRPPWFLWGSTCRGRIHNTGRWTISVIGTLITSSYSSHSFPRGVPETLTLF
jgi:hypothetical protein